MTTARRRRPATATRILAAGVAVGAASGGVAFMAANDPNVVIRTVASPAPPAPPAKVVVIEVQHRAVDAPPSAPASGAPSTAPRRSGSSPTATGSGPSTASAPAPAVSTPAPTASAPAPTPPPTAAPATKTGPS